MHNRKRSFFRSFIDLQQPKPLKSPSKMQPERKVTRILAIGLGMSGAQHIQLGFCCRPRSNRIRHQAGEPHLDPALGRQRPAHD
jgi:hypothetical protein